MPPKLLLVDAFNLIRRIYEARPGDDKDADIEGVVTSATQSLQRALDRHQPTHASCVFEHHDATWRHLLYPAYKENRTPTPEGLLAGLGLFQEAFSSAGVQSLAVESYEADDVIATLAVRLQAGGGEAVILSTDKMYLQLLSDRISIYDHFSGKFLTTEHVLAKYGVRSDQLIDYWSLAGDSTNNIKGVRSIGPKSAAALLEEFGTLAAILQATGDADANRMVVKVQEQEHAALVSRQLVSLKCDVDVGTNLKEMRYRRAS